MAAPIPVLYYGANQLFLGENPRITKRADGFDEGEFTFHLGNETSLEAGTQVPGYGGMYVSVNSMTDHSGDLEHNIRAIGLRSGNQRLIASTATDSEDGFDTGSETWILPRGSKFSRGRRHSDYSQLVAVSISDKRSPVDQYQVVEVGFKGIKNAGRPVKRSISSNIDISVVDNLVLIGVDNRNPHKWAITFPKVTVTFSYLGNGTPLKRMPEQGGSPAGELPTIQVALTSLPTSDQLTWHWPSGWRLVSMPQEEIPGTTIRFTQEVWEWQQTVTP